MNYIIKTSLLIVFLILFKLNFACTTFLISGKYTHDGRPILYKNRDTKELNNSLVYFKDGKYPYIALVDGNDEWSKMVWGGCNEAGFAIINSAAYNNNIGDTSKAIDREGIIMKLALQYCKTLKDFEKLLDTIKKPMGADANFGVIDAYGGAAFYETGNFKYKKFDANDSLIAPNGYLIRTNYSTTGNLDFGHGHCRFNTTSKFLSEINKGSRVNVQDFFNYTSRNLTHSLTNTNLWNDMPIDTIADIRFFIDYIPRSSTSAAILIEGAKNENDTKNAVMWTILGFPISSVAIPVWVAGGENLPKILSMQKNLHSPLCDAALKVKTKCFPPITKERGYDYINLSAVINKQNTGCLQLLRPIESEIEARSLILIQKLNDSGTPKDEIQKYYHWVDAYVNESYIKLFGIKLIQ